MNVQPQTETVNFPQKEHREFSSWLRTMRERSEKKEQAETTQQIILVVDNSPMRQFYTSIFLQRLKYHVITTKTAEDTLSFLNLFVPLAIIANVDLPQMNGLELLTKVKQNRRTRFIPFLICTLNKDPLIKQRCEKAGCAAYLSQEAPLDELYITLQKATETKPRRFIRLATHLDVIIGDSLPPESNGRRDSITAISEKGVFVNTNRPLAYGSVHLFTFFLPTAPGWVFRIEGNILYNHSASDSRKQPGIGVKFMKIGTQEEELIKAFIKKTLLEGIAIQ
jgi:two-component system chemotaxis response regulator CheY